MSRSWLVLVGISVAVAAAVGCGGYRVVKKTPEGGIVALKGDQTEARQKADEYMTSTCGGPYDIVEEGEAVIGETNSSETRATSYGTMRSTGQSTQKTEWRLTYKCRGKGGPAVAPAGSGAPAPAASSAPATSELHTLILRF
jgi:hypothetical protein